MRAPELLQLKVVEGLRAETCAINSKVAKLLQSLTLSGGIWAAVTSALCVALAEDSLSDLQPN